jgi:hypothetical protein
VTRDRFAGMRAYRKGFARQRRPIAMSIRSRSGPETRLR